MSRASSTPESVGPWPSLAAVDPRLRILAAVAFSILVALADRLGVLGAALGAAVLAMGISGVSPGTIVRRLLPLNLLLLAVGVVLPLTTAGEAAGHLGPVPWTHEGLLLAARIALKGNAILLMLVSLLGTMDGSTFGHAMSHLRVPDKLTHLLLFTVRYLDVLRLESLRLRGAMKVRGFRPGVNRHTYRTYGYLVGMLLVRSFDRSERIVAAMKCRGFRGRFYLLDHFHYHASDLPFAVISLGILAALAWGEWWA